MAIATVGSLEVLGLVPRTLGTAAAGDLERALAGSLRADLVAAFQVLGQLDPGAVWVIRRLDVWLTVPVSEPDAERQSTRIARGLVAAIEKVVRDGPCGDAVRFAGQADYVAAYLRARLAGHGDAWVFERFAALSALPPADALPAATRVAEVDLLAVVQALITAGVWAQLLEASQPVALVRLAAALERRVAGVVPGAEELMAVKAARTARSERLGPAGRRLRGAAELLGLLGDVADARSLDPAVVAAVIRLAPSPEPEPPAVASPRRPAGDPPRATADPIFEPHRAAASAPADDPAAAWVGSFASPGAVGFMLLPDLAELIAAAPLLAAETPEAAATREALLRGVLADQVQGFDEAISLAAGLGDRPTPDSWQRFLDGPVTAWAEALAADPVFGWEHPGDADYFDPVRACHSALGFGAAVLLRRFAQHLPGFGRAGAAHLVPRVLPPGGRVDLSEDLIEVILPAPQLHVLLAMAGLDTFACRPSWLPTRIVVSHEARS